MKKMNAIDQVNLWDACVKAVLMNVVVDEVWDDLADRFGADYIAEQAAICVAKITGETEEDCKAQMREEMAD